MPLVCRGLQGVKVKERIWRIEERTKMNRRQKMAIGVARIFFKIVVTRVAKKRKGVPQLESSRKGTVGVEVSTAFSYFNSNSFIYRFCRKIVREQDYEVSVIVIVINDIVSF